MNARFKRILVLFLPPIVLEGLRRLRRKTSNSTVTMPIIAAFRTKPDWEAMPDSEQVWSADVGWEHPSIVETQRSKWNAFLASVERPRPMGVSHEAPPDAPIDVGPHNTIMTFGYALGRAMAAHSSLSVLDWGGGLGHYYVFARALYPDVKFDYVVKDLPHMCDVGRDLLPDAEFVSDENAALARQYDIVFASSSVQYARDLYGLLARLAAAASGWILITRSPFVDTHDDFVVVQRPHAYGYMTEYAGWFINRKRFVDFICEQGFTLEREFLLAEAPFVPNAPEAGRFCGFLFRRIVGSSISAA
jgi:putative methyltransferase (TIGR04325 family)